ncbi:MAG: DNA primase, partial [Clostridiales bacterium]
DKQIFYCFGCQKGGNAIHFLMEMENLTLPEAAEKLAAACGVTIPQKQLSPLQKSKNKEKQDLLLIHQLAGEFYHKKLLSGNYPLIGAYLQKRGLSSAIIEEFSLGYAPDDDWQALADYLMNKGFPSQLIEKGGLASKSPKNGHYYDKFHGSLIFPIRDYRGQIVAFGGRIMGDGQPKYLNSTQTPIYNKSEHLFALKEASSFIRQRDQAVIMEGYMDVLTAHQMDIKNAIAPLGTAFTKEQASLLRRYTDNVLLAFDGDAAGIKAAYRSIEILRNENFNIKIITFPSDMDPDDFLQKNGLEAWQDLAEKSSLGVLDFLLNLAYQKHGGSNPAEKGQIVKDILPALAKTKSSVERESFISALAQRMQVDKETIYEDFRKNGYSFLPGKKQKNSGVISPKVKAVFTNSREMQILKLMLEDRDFYLKAKQALGEDFPQSQEGKILLAMAEELSDKYNWQLNSLLPLLDRENIEQMAKNEGLRQFLLKLIQLVIPIEDLEAGKEKFLGEYIRSRKIINLKQEMENLQDQLSLRDVDICDILGKISRLQQDMQKLKASGC